MAILDDYIGKEVVFAHENLGTFLGSLSKYDSPFVEFTRLYELATHESQGRTLFASELMREKVVYHQNKIDNIYLAKELESKKELVRQ